MYVVQCALVREVFIVEYSKWCQQIRLAFPHQSKLYNPDSGKTGSVWIRIPYVFQCALVWEVFIVESSKWCQDIRLAFPHHTKLYNPDRRLSGSGSGCYDSEHVFSQMM